MNAADNKHEEPMPIIEGPGKQLRDIRVAKELDINRIASLLHLNVGLLKALEADDFSALPGTVFVQGYLKNYARLLDTPAEPILEAFRQFRPQVEEKMDLKAAKLKHEVRSSHTVVRLITWLLVIGIIALVVTWWRGYLQWPIDLGIETSGTLNEQQLEDGRSDQTPPGEMNGSVSLPPLLGKPEILDAPLSETSASDESGNQPETAAEPELAAIPVIPVIEESASIGQTESPVVAETEQAMPEATETPVVAVPETVEMPAEETPAPATVNRIEVSFLDACWADIRDASGDFRVAGNKAAGERFVLTGVPPYTMVFGNAAAVKVTVSGEAYDLTPYTRGNVARLTLDPR